MKNPLFKYSSFFSLILFLISGSELFAQQSPFNGQSFIVPGLLEAEDFDSGGEGVAYHDADATNNGGAYRDSGVDIEPCSEGGYNIGWINAGEWLEYTITVPYTSLYEMSFRIASESGSGSFHLEVAGNDITGPVTFSPTGGWQSWETIHIDSVSLTGGEQVLRFFADNSDFNLNNILITQQSIANPPSVAIISPADNAVLNYDQPVEIIAVASDSGGAIARVEFTADDQLIGQDDSEPFQIMWQPPKPANYDLRAIAIDNAGAITVSQKIDVLVRFPQFDNRLSFSHDHGFYDADFSLGIDSDSADVMIRYTLDGSDPVVSGTAISRTAPATILISPTSTVARGRTPGVVVRAVGLKNDSQNTAIYTRTYLFVNEVRNQDHPGGDWPESGINGQVWTYAVNQEVVKDFRYRNVIDDALLDIPSISLVTDLDNFFASDSGIYVNAQYHGYAWERPVSAELLNPDGSPGFQIDAGLRIRGGWSRHNNYPKHALRLFFREEYGYSRLEYPLFGAEGVSSFKNMDLRTSQNYAWSNGYIYQNTMNRDVFSRDLQAEMGQLYTRSRYYHLYINGLYWGLYQSQERPESDFAESYLGGNANDYDIVKVDIGENWNLYEIEATDGNLDAWYDVWLAAQKGFQDNADYFGLEGKLDDGTPDPLGRRLVDIDNLIDYMLIIFYTGNFDAPVSKFSGNYNPNNFYAIYNRAANEGFKFLAHDSEHSLHVDPESPGIGLNEDRVNINLNVQRFEKFHPQWLHKRLSENPEYRVRFMDRVYRHFFNTGVLTPARATGIFQESANDIDMAIIAESARWGDPLRSKDNAWFPAINQIVNDFFPVRGDIVIGQLQTAGLYSTLQAPAFRSDGQVITQNSFELSPGANFELVNPNGTKGTIKYTINGSDPRLIGGGIAADARDAGAGAAILINQTVVMKARVFDAGSWSPLHEILLSGSQDLSTLIMTEIHYHPLDQGLISGSSYEFLELHNSGSKQLDISLLSFADGIVFTFAPGTQIAPDEYIVVASDSVRFRERYGFSPFNQYDGQLNNAGEEILLVNAHQDTLIYINYLDSLPWPLAADGDGYSLVWTNKSGNSIPNEPKNWAASAGIHGSPGKADLRTSISGSYLPAPSAYKLYPNFPNPFNPSTTIEFDTPYAGHVRIIIYDILGKQVAVLADREFIAGNHRVTWNAGNISGGLYFYMLKTNNYIKTNKMLLLR